MQGSFDRIIRQADAPVIEECREGRPPAVFLEHVVNHLGHLVVQGEFRALFQSDVLRVVAAQTWQDRFQG